MIDILERVKCSTQQFRWGDSIWCLQFSKENSDSDIANRLKNLDNDIMPQVQSSKIYWLWRLVGPSFQGKTAPPRFPGHDALVCDMACIQNFAKLRTAHKTSSQTAFFKCSTVARDERRGIQYESIFKRSQNSPLPLAPACFQQSWTGRYHQLSGPPHFLRHMFCVRYCFIFTWVDCCRFRHELADGENLFHHIEPN